MNDMQNSRLMAAIKELRDALGVTQNQLAIRIGKSTPTVQRYENVVPPKGGELARFFYLAKEAQRPDLAKIFRDAATAGIPPELITLIREKDFDEPAKDASAKGKDDQRKQRTA